MELWVNFSMMLIHIWWGNMIEFLYGAPGAVQYDFDAHLIGTYHIIPPWSFWCIVVWFWYAFNKNISQNSSMELGWLGWAARLGWTARLGWAAWAGCSAGLAGWLGWAARPGWLGWAGSARLAEAGCCLCRLGSARLAGLLSQAGWGNPYK